PISRIYMMGAILKRFKGHTNVEIQIFRHGADDAELAALQGKNLVGPADPEVPPEALAGATEEAALRCLLEAFTKEEADALTDWLQTRYADQISDVYVSPLDLPIPLGVGPLGLVPSGRTDGFICFDAVRGYPLPFVARGYYDLASQESFSGSQE
ncbi:MAG: hypothetical protein K6F46_00260, partial [Desulfovibrio sp.]|nr:hypothetical protein [Desulfovibrio sp.]